MKLSSAAACMLLMLAPAGSFAADQPGGQTNAATQSGGSPRTERSNFFGRIASPYLPKIPPVPSMANSDRIESLLRAGNLYLSLQDTIALALENNLDLQLQRYVPLVAETNLLRAQAGGFATPTSTAVLAGPASVTGAPPSAGLQTLIVAGSTAIGITPPSLDPMLTGNAGWAHNTTPQSSSFVTGSNSLIQRTIATGIGVQQNFLTGTLVNLGLTNSNAETNNLRAQFNPATNSSLTLSVTQHLLQGYGPALNSRQIRIARNNREISDLTFKAQVITTVSAITDLYWDLVSYNENVRVQRDALAASQRLLEDDMKQVEVGTMAPIEVTRAQAEIASGQQALTVAQTQLLQQETILKNALSKTGVLSPAIASAHVMPTDRIHISETEAIMPMQDLSATAISSRPELAQFRIMIQNQDIAIKGTKSELLPTLDLVGQLTNNGLAGQVNPLVAGSPSAFFVGGYGTVLSQIFARNFPTYSIGVNLNIPIHNRAAQADLINGELVLRQQQVGIQRLENQVRVEVQNAVIGVQQARAQYESAIKQRVLQEETVDAEQKKLAAGVSTTYNVILTERDLVTAESNELAAESAYAKAKVELSRATGQTLYDNNISLDEAFKGKVARPPSPIPDGPPAARLTRQ
ncbi:MAG TPA: TolC family protein [Bryobacteraceae bacterium]|nr:TolC family protein [Bryobacteraceae bacterium]